MFWKLRVVSVLLFLVVPSRCFPVVAVGGAIDEASAARRPGTKQPHGRGEVWFIGILAVVGAWTNVRTSRLFRRVRAEPDGSWFGLSRDASLVLIAVGYVLGLLCGAQFVMLTFGMT